MDPKEFRLRPGGVYRTADLKGGDSNRTRWARRLVRQGRLRELRPGLYLAPKDSAWGSLPADGATLMKAFLKGGPFVFTGTMYWNALGLGSTSVSPEVLVYNTKRSGVFELSGRRFRLRRVSFPRKPSPEWYAVDLLENYELSGVDLEVLEQGLARALRARTLHAKAMLQMAEDYGTLRTRGVVVRAIEQAA